MASSTLGKFVLRSTSTISLHERFTELLNVQLAPPSMVTFHPTLLQQSNQASIRNQQLVLLMEQQPSVQAALQARSVKQRLGKGSIWSRLGRPRGACRFRGSFNFRRFGFWNFRRRYRWGARRHKRIGFTYRSSSSLQRGRVLVRVGQQIVVRRTGALGGSRGRKWRGQMAGGGWRGRGKREQPITKQELDNQLDEYMSTSKTRLDADLDEYMSMSKSRLDADLDEYMAMAGDYQLD